MKGRNPLHELHKIKIAPPEGYKFRVPKNAVLSQCPCIPAIRDVGKSIVRDGKAVKAPFAVLPVEKWNNSHWTWYVLNYSVKKISLDLLFPFQHEFSPAQGKAMTNFNTLEELFLFGGKMAEWRMQHIISSLAKVKGGIHIQRTKLATCAAEQIETDCQDPYSAYVLGGDFTLTTHKLKDRSEIEAFLKGTQVGFHWSSIGAMGKAKIYLRKTNKTGVFAVYHSHELMTNVFYNKYKSPTLWYPHAKHTEE